MQDSDAPVADAGCAAWLFVECGEVVRLHGHIESAGRIGLEDQPARGILKSAAGYGHCSLDSEDVHRRLVLCVGVTGHVEAVRVLDGAVGDCQAVKNRRRGIRAVHAAVDTVIADALDRHVVKRQTAVDRLTVDCIHAAPCIIGRCGVARRGDVLDDHVLERHQPASCIKHDGVRAYDVLDGASGPCRCARARNHKLARPCIGQRNGRIVTVMRHALECDIAATDGGVGNIDRGTAGSRNRICPGDIHRTAAGGSERRVSPGRKRQRTAEVDRCAGIAGQ